MKAKLESQIESILLFRNEPVTASELEKLLGASKLEIEESIKSLQSFYEHRGIVLVTDGESYVLGTHPENSELIEKIQKEEFSRELGRAGLETLAIVLYRAPVSRREIDQIRGVNSGFILRSLLIRGLIEKVDPSTTLGAGRSFSYQPTLKLFQHLGVTRKEDLPEFDKAFQSLEQFVKAESKEDHV